MKSFKEYVKENFPESNIDLNEKEIIKKALNIAKKFPLTGGALVGSSLVLGATNQMHKNMEKDYHLSAPEKETKGEKLPPLKPSKNKIVGKIVDDKIV